MRTIISSFCIICFVALNSFAQNSATFWGVEEMGFIGIDIGNTPTTDTLIVTATIDTISVSDTTAFYGELIYSTGNKVSNAVSVFGVDMCIQYYDRAGIKYEFPLGPENLREFGEKAKWTIKKK